MTALLLAWAASGLGFTAWGIRTHRLDHQAIADEIAATLTPWSSNL